MRGRTEVAENGSRYFPTVCGYGSFSVRYRLKSLLMMKQILCDFNVILISLPQFLCQVLYFCVPFREKLLEYYEKNKNHTNPEENLLTCLADLFAQVVDLNYRHGYLFAFMRV